MTTATAARPTIEQEKPMSNSQPLYFDIETEPQAESDIAHMVPTFTAPANYKDAAKIAENIAEQKAKWLSDCALHAETCRVLCVGTIQSGGFHCFDGNEKNVVDCALMMIAQALRARGNVIGFNILQFDLPVLIRRARILGVPVSPILRQRYRGRSYWHEDIFDLMEEWSMGTRRSISLDALAKALGVGSKNGNGADFAALWHSDRENAIAYLRNDCELLKACAERML